MNNYTETAEDLYIKYDKTYIESFLKGYRNVLLLGTFTPDKGSYRVHIKKVKDGLLLDEMSEPWENIKNTSSLAYPSLGAINLPNSVVFLKRKVSPRGNSKYRKTMTSESFVWGDPNHLDRISLSMKYLANLSKSKLLNTISSYIFFKRDFTFEEAIDSVLSGERVGTGFSENYCVTANIPTNSILMWRGMNVIGKLNKTKDLFEMTTDAFNDELLSYKIPIGG